MVFPDETEATVKNQLRNLVSNSGRRLMAQAIRQDKARNKKNRACNMQTKYANNDLPPNDLSDSA